MATIESAPLDRVAERKRAVLLARHYREAEGLTIIQIAQRLGRAPATVKGYFYDPTGEKARAVKRRYRGVCRGCGAPTTRPQRQGRRLRATARTATPERSRAMDARTGTRSDTRLARPLRQAPVLLRLVTHDARRRGAQALERLEAGDWPAPSTVIDLYTSWTAAVADAVGGA